MSLATAISILHFNPLHHEGGDHQILIMSVLFNYFNPLHHEGGDWCGALTPAAGINFNPLHHEGGDARFVDWRMKISISIHSTTRVETCSQASIANSLMISIHSTTRVETIGVSRTSIISVDFNPLHHEGGDAVRATGSPRESISIHSTTRVETLTGRLPTAGLGFQSTPPRGWRQQYYTITTTILQHISTNKSYPTPSNHGQPSLHTRKSVLIVQIFRCESPRKSMFASGSHQNTLYRFTARGQVRISAVLPH